MKTILVPIDGSEYSDRAVLKAKEIADSLGSKIILINIINLTYTISYYDSNPRIAQSSSILDWPKLVEKSKSGALELLEKAKNLLGDTDVETVMLDEPGADLARSIVEFAKERDVDMIVMGSNGMGSLKHRIYLGSVTTKVLHTTDKSVLVVQ